MYSLSTHWLLVVLTACASVGVSYDCHLLFSSFQYQCHLVLNTWPAAATTDDTVDRRRILKGLEFTADQGRKPKWLHKVASLLNFCIFHTIKFMKLNMILSVEWTTYSKRLKKNLKNSGLTFAKIRTRRYLHWVNQSNRRAGHCDHEFPIKFFFNRFGISGFLMWMLSASDLERWLLSFCLEQSVTSVGKERTNSLLVCLGVTWVRKYRF